MIYHRIPEFHTWKRKFQSVSLTIAVVAVIILSLFSVTSANIFTSSLKVQRMVLEEEELLGEFKKYIDEQYEKLKTFSNFYTDRIKDIRSRTDTKTLQELDHPNSAYTSIKRFASEYSNVLGDHLNSFMRHIDTALLADYEDIKGARLSLLRLQAVYGMKALDMAKGDYLGYQGPSLSYADAYEIGQTAFTEAKLNESLDWLNASLALYATTELPQSPEYGSAPTEGAIKALKGRVHMFMGDYHLAEALYDESKRLDPYSGDMIELEKELTTQPQVDQPQEKDYFANFSRLCSLENRHHPAKPNSPEAICRYRKTGIPFYVFKEEILSVTPFASVIYDVISDPESDHFKNKVRNKLHRGAVEKLDGGGSRYTEARTSDLAWIWDSESEIASNVARRVEKITGLDCTQRPPDGPHSGEAFQVVNYGLGGHYEVHMDPLKHPSATMVESGERIATFLVYLSDVKRGGATVFTKAGVSVAPKKNMALFWYNFDPAHNADDLTQHAGCPVLIGQKWITNKWIWTAGNTFKRRCPLDPSKTQMDIEADMLDGYGAGH